jgi:hypothetical protein
MKTSLTFLPGSSQTATYNRMSRSLIIIRACGQVLSKTPFFPASYLPYPLPILKQATQKPPPDRVRPPTTNQPTLPSSPHLLIMQDPIPLPRVLRGQPRHRYRNEYIHVQADRVTHWDPTPRRPSLSRLRLEKCTVATKKTRRPSKTATRASRVRRLEQRFLDLMCNSNLQTEGQMALKVVTSQETCIPR